jgi:hypothetical protein
MAIVHKVIVLNKPFKVFGFTFVQLIFLALAGLIGLWLGTAVPQVKINGIQLGAWITFVITPCVALVAVNASSIKPWQWWRNRILSLSNLLPTEILPKPSPANMYPLEDRNSSRQL